MKSWGQIVLLWLISVQLQAGEDFCWQDNADSHTASLTPHVQFTRDPSRSLSLPQAQTPETSYLTATGDTLNFGSTNDLFWFRIPLHNCSDQYQQLLFMANIVRAANLDVYLEQQGETRALFISDELGTTASNIRRYKTLSFPVHLQAGERAELWVRFMGANNTYLPFQIKPAAQQGFDMIDGQMKLSAIMAGILALIVFNTILFLFTQMRVFVSYVVIEGLNLLYLWHITGGTTMHLWGDGPWDQYVAGILASSITTMTAVFTREYFETGRYHRTLDRVLQWLVWAGVAFIALKIISYAFPQWRASHVNAVGYLVAYITLPVSMVTAFMVTFFGQQGAREQRLTGVLVLLAWVILTGNVVIMGLRTMNIIDYTAYTETLFGLAILIESVLIAFALAVRIRELYRDKNRHLESVSQLQQEQLMQQQRERQILEEKAWADHSAAEAGKLVLAVAHDGRQMLTALQNYTAVVEQLASDERVRDVGGRAGAVANSLTDMFNHALDVADRSDYELTPNLSTFSLDRVLEPLSLLYRHAAVEKGLNLKIRACRIEIHSDRVILLRMLGNLISNAIAHTEQGKILVGARKRGDCCVIQVWDSGNGIDETALREVLGEDSPLSRTDQAPAAETLNFGLGLKATQTMASRIEAQLRLVNRDGRGTLAEIIIPLDDSQLQNLKQNNFSSAAV